MTEQTPIAPDPAQNVTPAPVAQPAASASNVPSQAAGAQPSEPQKPKGLDAIIGHAYDEHDPDKPVVTDNAQKTRDPKGRFAKNTSPEASPQGASEGESKTDPAAVVAEPAPTAQHLEPHPRWSDAQKQAFAKLAPEGQSILLEQAKSADAYFTQETQRLAETRKQVEPLISALEPFQGYFQAIGRGAHQAIPELLQAEATLRFGSPEQKLQLFARLANDYQVPLAAFTGNGEPGQQQSPVLHPAYQQLAQRLDAAERRLLVQQQESEQANYSAAASQIEAFATEKDSAGQPKYPFYGTVRAAMGQIIQQAIAEGKSIGLPEAYKQAAAPLESAMAEQLTRQQANLAEQQKAAIEKARNASPVKTSGAPNGKTTPKGLDGWLSHSIAQAGI